MQQSGGGKESFTLLLNSVKPDGIRARPCQLWVCTYDIWLQLQVLTIILHNFVYIIIGLCVGTEGPGWSIGSQRAGGASKDHSFQHPPAQPKGWTAKEMWHCRSGQQRCSSQILGRRESSQLQHKDLWCKVQSNVFHSCKRAAVSSDSQGIPACKRRRGGRGGGKVAAEPLHRHHLWSHPWSPSYGEEADWRRRWSGPGIHRSLECRCEGSVSWPWPDVLLNSMNIGSFCDIYITYLEMGWMGFQHFFMMAYTRGPFSVHAWPA